MISISVSSGTDSEWQNLHSSAVTTTLFSPIVFNHSFANVIDILDPDAIIIGGGLSNIDFLYSEGVESIYSKVFSDYVETPILKNKLGDSSGVFGAALLD